MEPKKIEFFNKFSFITLISTIFLSMFFFIPFVPVTLAASKGFLISIGTVISLFFWLIARLGEGKFVLPKDRLILFAGAIPAVFLISSLFSSSLYTSLFGSGFEVGTFGSMLILFIIFFLSSIYFKEEKNPWYFLGSIALSAIILSVFQLFNIFVGFGSFFGRFFQGISSGNLVGSWNDFALLFGMFVLLSLYSMEFLKTKKIYTIASYFLLVTGMFFLIVVNIPLVWILVAIFATVLFVYSISVQHQGVNIVHGEEKKKKFPFQALIVVFISLFFLVGSNSLGLLISKYINLPNTEVRPSLMATGNIAIKAIKHNPFFGTGPNTFVNDWDLWQPKEITKTDYWNTSFSSGYSFLSTILVTTGLLGFLAMLLFIVVFFVRGIQSLIIALKNTLSNYFIFTTLMISIYSWVSVIVYNPNIIMLTLAFASSGMIIGILVNKKGILVKEYSFLKDPRSSFFSILGLMILLVATVFVVYIYINKFVSIVYFSKGLNVENTTESLSRSEKMIINAITLDKNDFYYRTLSQVYLSQMGVLINDKNLSQDILKASLQKLVNAAQSSALGAVTQNPKQYLNYMNLGNVYSSLVSLSVEKSYESAVQAYDRAKVLAPNNPAVLLARAQLELTNKNKEEAKKIINEALVLKENYTDALFLLAQIENDDGNVGGAIKQIERAGQVNPNDPNIFFKLGLLRYDNSDYSGAVGAFEQAVILDPNYLNARYFLGQSYQKVGRSSDALVQYEILKKVIPDNQGLKDAIESVSKTQPVSADSAKTKTDNKNTKNIVPAKENN